MSKKLDLIPSEIFSGGIVSLDGVPSQDKYLWVCVPKGKDANGVDASEIYAFINTARLSDELRKQVQRELFSREGDPITFPKQKAIDSV